MLNAKCFQQFFLMFFYFCAIIKGYDKNPDQKPILPAMYVQLSLDVSISQKYWRMFLRKVNMAFLEMGSLFKFPEHTRLMGKSNENVLGQLAQSDSFSRSEEHPRTRLCLVFCSRRTNLGGKTWRSPYQAAQGCPPKLLIWSGVHI